MKVSTILKNKGPEVITVGGHKTLFDAMQLLVNNKIGALLVIDMEATLIGIISERDIIRAVFSNPETYITLPIKDFMATKVIVVEPDDELEYVESIITKNRIRHLPVVSNKRLVGLISIGDVVKTMLTDIKFENKYLMDYIHGNVF